MKHQVNCENCKKQLPNKMITIRDHICFECASDTSLFTCKADAMRLLLELSDKKKYYFSKFVFYKVEDFTMLVEIDEQKNLFIDNWIKEKYDPEADDENSDIEFLRAEACSEWKYISI